MPNPNPGSARLSAITQHLDASSSPLPPATTTPHTMSEPKPPITCHVLDTTIGRPAANIPVTLTLHSTTSSSSSTTHPTTFTATTNADGRVTSWTPSTPFSSTPLSELYASATGDQKYSITFDTEEYFGGKGIQAFFPEVEVKFLIRAEKKKEHYHVPVLLGPFGYTTYRGS